MLLQLNKKMLKIISSIFISSFIILTSIFLINKYTNKPQIIQDNELIDKLEIQFIDVGQGDCILIRENDSNMLIDAGDTDIGDDLVKYLKGLGIKKFDNIVMTHFHKDHIGGMIPVINNFEISNVYLSNAPAKTPIFENVLKTLIKKKQDGYNVTIKNPKVGEEFNMQNCKFKVLDASSHFKDLNGASIVLKLCYGEKTFLFEGDALRKNENIIMRTTEDLKSDVLKVSHHGSRLSTSKKFLDMVNPEYAVISVSEDNDYMLPSDTLLNRLESNKIKIFRTDKDGTITVNCDGKDIDIKTTLNNE